MWASTRYSSQTTNKVLVVRQDLKMRSGKIASQCAHAATGMYAELMQRNKIQEAAENIGLPTFVVADAGRTQVAAGSKTVLAVGPGPKMAVDSVTGKLNLL
ncbi:Peptidyl-tRNA hydrolase, PTH2 [Corchorus olitorius]|uniref:peptidyl-tRNA hydrolase n=1 Tax=Corchorus olitorius TaxID=93759 RepID=A0A1R3IVW1_9ROSI|nr:Peptidyl-tRNA hydrolase, PTH2 [Corchorus olitorius]